MLGLSNRTAHALMLRVSLTTAVLAGCGKDDGNAGGRDAAAELDSGTDSAIDESGPDAALDAEGDASNDGGDGDGDGDGDAGDASSNDHTAPQLIASSPDDGDDNVAFDAPIELVFSEPVILGDGSFELTQVAPERAIAVSVELSADGRTATLALEALPDLPAELRLTLSAEITDLAGNPLEPETLNFELPVWQRLGSALDRDPDSSATDVQLALDAEGRAVLLSVEGDSVYASRLEDGVWDALGGALPGGDALASPGAEPRIALTIDEGSAPIAAYRTTSGVVVQRWDGTAWLSAGDVVDPLGGGSYAPTITLGPDGAPVVAFDALNGSAQPVLRVRTLNGASWETLADLDIEARGARLTRDGQDAFVLAYQEAPGGISVMLGDASDLVPIGAGTALPAVSGSFSISALGPSRAVSAQGQGTVSWSSGEWEALPQDLGFLISSQALDRTLAHAPDGALLAAFAETPSGEVAPLLYVQRFDEGRFQPLGPALNRDRDASASMPALAVASSGEPLVAYLETPQGGGSIQVFVVRYNGNPAAPPAGLRTRSFDPECLATAPLDGSQLTATNCFADAIGREPLSSFIPFDVRSPLWTDGAHKRRFVMLPEGTSITYRDPGIWTMPVGTILIKEFSIEARRGDPSSLRPVETRFLVVREGGPWDRYTYQWNQAGTEALLRVAAPAIDRAVFDIEDESGVATTQTHFFPTRAACLQCHETPGTVLGLQTAMMNRNLDYGATVDNQLRALAQLGVFGDSFEADDLPLARTMPNPSDTTYPIEDRLRAYLHANCSSCHHPLFGMDLRIQNATLDSGLCTKISKGDLDASVIYWRDVLRQSPSSPGTPAPMPPLGTLAPNPLLETLLTDWILDPQNACP